MKHFYTSNYARKGNHPLAYAISAKPPTWYSGKILTTLAPSWEILNDYKSGTITEEDYTIRYLESLYKRKVNPHELVNALPDGAILLCYESPTDFCHRHAAAEWIEHHTGVKVTEFLNDEEIKLRNIVDRLLLF